MKIVVKPVTEAASPARIVFVDGDLNLILPPDHPRLHDLQGVLIAANGTGKTGEVISTYNEAENCWYYLCGVDLSAEIRVEQLRRASAAAVKSLQKRFKKVDLYLTGSLAGAELMIAAVEGARLGRTQKAALKGSDNGVLLEAGTILVEEKNLEVGESAANRAVINSSATLLCRELTDKPANLLTPEKLAGTARGIAEHHGFGLQVFDVDKLAELGMHSILQVGAGSVNAPCLILLDSKPDSDEQPFALVGKGITFDSGGISIKPSKDMHEMRGDMGGAATVLSVADALGAAGYDKRFIVAVPAAENMTGSNAQRPGDVITAFDGTTVEVLNTDAEGRLVLADALAYVRKTYSPRFMIDVATLTGAVVIALGRHAAGMMSNAPELEAMLTAAGETTYERVWPLPMFEEYKKQLDSSIADLQNIGGREAGSITAGWFLRHFVGDTPWAHLDIAGVSWISSASGYLPKGPTGTGVRLLIEALQNQLPSSL